MMHKNENKLLIAVVLLFLLIACSIPIHWVGFSDKHEGDLQLLADIGKYKNNEPTPFQPFRFTATPTRDVQPITGALVPNPGLLPPEDQVNILLLGSDWRPNSGYRTDVILLASINKKEATVSLISFPRDLWVEIPGIQKGRINTAMGYGGFPLLKATFEHNFAIPIDYYMMTNFSGFTNIIDTLGGIDIVASRSTADRCDLSYQHGAWCSIDPGPAHLDGEWALWYVRSRYTSDDFDRTRRAQEVMEGLFNKLMSLDAVARAPELYNLFISSVETDMAFENMLPLVAIAPAILSDTARVTRYYLGREQVTPYVIPSSGANVLLPNYDSIWEIIKKAVYQQ
ncbi:MAG: LCP family protein [Anaerolineaceae bacterium]|nr:LCP family protein [Anaerolineaceae bacterium]